MKRAAEDYRTREVSFNMRGMMCNFVPVLNACMYDTGRDGQGVQRRVFCSQYIVLLFQAAGYLTELDAASTSPADLYLALCDAGAKGDLNSVMYERRARSGRKRAPLDLSRALRQHGTQKGARHGYKE